jgi:hypothetical protein
MSEEHNRPSIVYVLWILVAFQAVSGITGGLFMLVDPTGQSLNIPGIFLMGTPFETFFVPGLLLLVFLGIFPTISLLGLLRIKWRWPQVLNIYSHIHWGWTYTLYAAIVLILWMDIQVYIIGYWHFIQTFNALTGVVILVITLMPQVVNYYRTSQGGGFTLD